MPAKRGRLFALIGITAAVIVCLGIGLGVGLGVGLHKKDTNLNAQTQTSGDSTSNSAGNTPADVSNTNQNQAITPLPAWDVHSQKMVGMSLGNMLVLERWMDEDWFTQTAGEDVWDEWGFSQALGSNAAAALETHWNNFISQENVTLLRQAGFNHLRIPVGFWAFIPLQDGEPYVSTGQIAQLERLAGYAYNEGMYIMLDLHGMPGSQNGLQQSGHNTSNIQFWNQQDRADATVKAAMEYILNSQYRSVYTSLAICNEPVTYTDGQLSILSGFYERSYEYVSSLSNAVPMVIHDAYQGLNYWKPFLSGKNSSLIWMEDHPYPGNAALDSGAGSSASNILGQVCSKAQGYASFPVPVAVTEWSCTTSILNDDFLKQFYAQQLSAFSNSAGSFWWSYRVAASSNPVVALQAAAQATYSFVDLYARGDIIATPTKNQSTASFLSSLGNPCNLPAQETWAATVA